MHLELYIFVALLIVGLIGIYMYLKTPQFTPYIPQNNAVAQWFDFQNNKDLCQQDPCSSPNVSFGADLNFVYYYQNRDPTTGKILDDKIFFDSDAYQKILVTDYDYKNDSGEDVVLALSGKVIDPEPVKNGTSRKGQVKGNVSFGMKEFIFPSNGVILNNTTLSITFTFVKS